MKELIIPILTATLAVFGAYIAVKDNITELRVNQQNMMIKLSVLESVQNRVNKLDGKIQLIEWRLDNGTNGVSVVKEVEK